MNIDDIDKQIIRELFKDGRESLTDLKDKIVKSNNETMSHTGIKKRIVKLKEGKVLKIQGDINIDNLGYKACYILLETKNFEVTKKIIKGYTDCPRVFLLSHISGQYDLIMGIVGQNMDILHRYINHCGPTNKEGILHSQILFALSFPGERFLPVKLFTNESQECKCENVCEDCEAFLSGKCDGCGKF
ncbi:MAG: hypothetical protein R6U96_04305 [Promethearchaeia archaeon]